MLRRNKTIYKYQILGITTKLNILYKINETVCRQTMLF